VTGIKHRNEKWRRSFLLAIARGGARNTSRGAHCVLLQGRRRVLSIERRIELLQVHTSMLAAARKGGHRLGRGLSTTGRRGGLLQRRKARRNAAKGQNETSSALQEVKRDTAPPPASGPWQAVTDKQSGLVYWWNTETNETTALGAPKPGSEANLALGQQQQQYQQPGLGRTMAEGAAFGAGAGIGRGLIGSLFGGFGGGDDGGGDGGDGGDGWV